MVINGVTMDTILILIAAIVILVIITKFLSRHLIAKGHKIWLSRILGLLAGIIISFLFLIFSIPSQNADSAKKNESTESTSRIESAKNEKLTEPAQTSETKPTDTNIKQVEKNLEVTTEVFAERMNANLKKADSPFRLNIHIEDGKVNDVFKYAFNDYLVMVGTIDKTSKNLSSITIITRGDGTTSSGVNIMAVVVSAYSAILGEDSMKTGEPGRVMIKLVNMKKNKMDEESTVSTILNGMKFSFMTNHTLGNWFTVEPE